MLCRNITNEMIWQVFVKTLKPTTTTTIKEKIYKQFQKMKVNIHLMADVVL